MTTAPPIRILNVNTHVGQSLREGGLRRAKRKYRPHIVTLQEVQRPTARARARRLFLALFWIRVGFIPASDGSGASGTLVFARRSRFKKLDEGTSNRLISAAIYNDRWHPERRMTKALLRDRRTGRLWRVMSVHTWTLARRQAAPAAILNGHFEQVDAYAHELDMAAAKRQSGVAIGDWNERVGSGGTYVERSMQKVEARDARPDDGDDHLSLDEAYVTDDVEVLVYVKIPEDEVTTDHPGIYLEVAA